MLGSILRTDFVRDVRFSGRVTFAWIPHAITEAPENGAGLVDSPDRNRCRIPSSARGGFFVFRFLLFTAGGEVSFVFVGFAISDQASIEQSTSIVWLVAKNISEVRVSRPGAIGWAAVRLCPPAPDTLPRQSGAR
jgi:hypothetical protein